jgi:hypothetical protein
MVTSNQLVMLIKQQSIDRRRNLGWALPQGPVRRRLITPSVLPALFEKRSGPTEAMGFL